MGDLALIPGLGRPPGQWNIPEEGNGYPLQYSGLNNFMECIVHGGNKELDTIEQISLHYEINNGIDGLDLFLLLGFYHCFLFQVST